MHHGARKSSKASFRKTRRRARKTRLLAIKVPLRNHTGCCKNWALKGGIVGNEMQLRCPVIKLLSNHEKRSHGACCVYRLINANALVAAGVW